MRSFPATHQIRFSALYGLAQNNDGVWGYINKSWRLPGPSGRAPRAQRRLRQLLGRLGTPEEIAAGILFLASDESRFAADTILTLDGGMTAQ